MSEISSDEAARRAGEAFIAASRAATPEERKRLRAEAEQYVEMLRQREQARIRAALESREE